MFGKISLSRIKQFGEYHIYLLGKSLCMPKLLQSVLSSKTDMVKEYSVSGVLTIPLKDLLAFVGKQGGRKLVEGTSSPCGGGCSSSTATSYVYSWQDNSFLDIAYVEKSNDITLAGHSLNGSLDAMMAQIEKSYVSQNKKKLVFAIVKTCSGFEIKSMGDGSSPLIRDNYHPQVIQDLDFVIQSFQKSPPNGRIAILNGEPGTGKTHLIRGLLSELDYVFLVVPSDMVSDLAKPELIPLLLDVRSKHSKPIILIIEDGDVCLVPRGLDNISIISALLNLSDGILGSIIDIKMIISTNAHIKQLDAAILRPGRLCKDIHVDALPYDQANAVYRRLTQDASANLEYAERYTLAEIYSIINNRSVEPASLSTHTSNRRVIGFTPSSSNYTTNLGK